MVLPLFQGLSTGASQAGALASRRDRQQLDLARLGIQQEQVAQADRRLDITSRQIDESIRQFDELQEIKKQNQNRMDRLADRTEKEATDAETANAVKGIFAIGLRDGLIDPRSGVGKLNTQKIEEVLRNPEADPTLFATINQLSKDLHKQLIPNAAQPTGLQKTPDGKYIAKTAPTEQAPQGSAITNNRSSNPEDLLTTKDPAELAQLLGTSFSILVGRAAQTDPEFSRIFGNVITNQAQTQAMAQAVKTSQEVSGDNPAVVSNVVSDLSQSDDEIKSSNQIIEALTGGQQTSSFGEGESPAELAAKELEAIEPLEGKRSRTSLDNTMPNLANFETGKIYSDDEIANIFENDPRAFDTLKGRQKTLRQFNSDLKRVEQQLASADPDSDNAKKAEAKRAKIIAEQKDFIENQKTYVGRILTREEKREKEITSSADQEIQKQIDELTPIVNSENASNEQRRLAQEEITSLQGQLSQDALDAKLGSKTSPNQITPSTLTPEENEIFDGLIERVGKDLADVRSNAYNPDAFTERLKATATNEDIEKAAKVAEDNNIKSVEDISKLENVQTQLSLLAYARLFAEPGSVQDRELALRQENLRETGVGSISELQRQKQATDEGQLAINQAELLRKKRADLVARAKDSNVQAGNELKTLTGALKELENIQADEEKTAPQRALEINRLMQRIQVGAKNIRTPEGIIGLQETTSAMALEVFDLAVGGAVDATFTEDVTSFFRRAKPKDAQLTSGYIQLQGDNLVITREPFDPEDPGKVREQVGAGISFEKFSRQFGESANALVKLLKRQEEAINSARGQNE